MRSKGVKRLWTHPELPMPDAYGRMSYVLFRADGDVGRVVAARVPDDGYVRVGDYVQDALGFCGEALAYVTRCHEDAPPLFILTDNGIGLLSGRYRLSAGLCLYLHIHTRPAAAARLINSGALGGDGRFTVSEEIRRLGGKLTARDSRSYPALLEAFRAVEGAPRRVFATAADRTISLWELRQGIADLAAFAGCELTFTARRDPDAPSVSPYTRVKCYRPLLPEGLLLCLLSELRERSPTGAGVCRLESRSNGGDGLALTIRYPVDPGELPRRAEEYDGIHDYLARVSEVWGLDLFAPVRPSPARGPEGLPEVAVSLAWLLDPSALSTSDIKSRLPLARETGREAPSAETEEVPFGPNKG